MIAKYWIAGQVKTRLARDLGNQAAAQIQQEFTLHLAQSLARAADDRYVFTAPDSACDDMQIAIGQAWKARPQGAGDLGQRISSAFQFLMNQASSARPVNAVLIGSDLPSLTIPDITAAFEELEDVEIVLGPARDGGYYLIGLRGPWNEAYQSLFEAISWSSDQVLAQTVQNAGRIGMMPRLLEVREDIDTLESLQRTFACGAIPQGLRAGVAALLDDGSMPCR